MAARARATQVIEFALNNSLLLVAGALVALIWANVDLEGYQRLTGAVHFAVDDVGMVFFFALATKEVYEATLPGGPLSSPRLAAVPLVAAAGGMIVPAIVYLSLVAATGRHDLTNGWAIPTATDIAFAYLIVRVIFPRGHPAIPFLLMLAIADDALGLIVLAVFYPSGPVALVQLALWVGSAIALAWLLKRGHVANFWLYVLGPGLLSWIGLIRGGIHPALALVPIIPFMPHQPSDLETLSRSDVSAVTTLQEFEHWWRIPVQFILLFFGLANAGVPLARVGTATWIVLVSLVLGKPLGIYISARIGDLVGFKRAPALDDVSVIVTGTAAGIGFTVALFFTTAAFPPGAAQDEAKIGALLSFLAAPIALLMGKARKARPASSAESS